MILVRIISALALFVGLLPHAMAADNKGKVLIAEDFSGSAIPVGWQGSKVAFSIVEGGLRGLAAPDDSHGPAIGRAISGHDLVVEFDLKFVRPGYFLFLIDGDSQFKGRAHLLRFSIGGNQYQLAQDRGDPAFYRIEQLARGTAKPVLNEWQHIRIELRGNQANAWFGDKAKLTATGTVWNVKKSRIVFLIAQTGDVRIDNVKVVGLVRNN